MRKYLSSQIGKTLELSQVLINRLSETKVFMSTFVWMTVDNIRFTMSNTDKKTNGKLSKSVVCLVRIKRVSSFPVAFIIQLFWFRIRFARRKKSFLPLMKKSVWIRMQNLFFFFFLIKRNFKSSTYFFSLGLIPPSSVDSISFGWDLEVLQKFKNCSRPQPFSFYYWVFRTLQLYFMIIKQQLKIKY
jgi:hypothetical protein